MTRTSIIRTGGAAGRSAETASAKINAVGDRALCLAAVVMRCARRTDVVTHFNVGAHLPPNNNRYVSGRISKIVAMNDDGVWGHVFDAVDMGHVGEFDFMLCLAAVDWCGY